MKVVKRCVPAPVWTSVGWATMSNLYEAHDEFMSIDGPNADPEFDMTLVVDDHNEDRFVNVRSIDFKEI